MPMLPPPPHPMMAELQAALAQRDGMPPSGNFGAAIGRLPENEQSMSAPPGASGEVGNFSQIQPGNGQSGGGGGAMEDPAPMDGGLPMSGMGGAMPPGMGRIDNATDVGMTAGMSRMDAAQQSPQRQQLARMLMMASRGAR